MADNTPKTPGFYWAKWRIIEDGSSTEQDATSNKWEVVEAFQNGHDKNDSEYMMVAVTGEYKPQLIENFYWSANGRIKAPNER